MCRTPGKHKEKEKGVSWLTADMQLEETTGN